MNNIKPLTAWRCWNCHKPTPRCSRSRPRRGPRSRDGRARWSGSPRSGRAWSDTCRRCRSTCEGPCRRKGQQLIKSSPPQVTQSMLNPF